MKSMSSCPVCHATGHPWATVGDLHYQNPGQWDIHECGACRARYLCPMPTPEELGSYYPQSYYSHQVQPTRPAASLAARIRSVLLPLGTGEPTFSRPGSMIDLGCGSGWMLERYRDQGWEVAGVEYSPSACDAGRSRGLDMHCGSLHDAALPAASLDYVRSNHSFEHLTDPIDTVREINRILKDGGTAFLGVPSTAGLMARLFRSRWYYVGAPVHTINYDHRNLPALLERNGFEVRRIRWNSTHGGTVGSLQSWLGRVFHRRVDLSSGPVTWPPFVLVGFWISRLLDAMRMGDCIEVTAVKRSPAPS